jgi:hypothetical protein
LISYKKNNPTTNFMQLLRAEKFKNKKIYIMKKKHKKEKKKEKSYLNLIASEAKKRKEKNKFIKYVN